MYIHKGESKKTNKKQKQYPSYTNWTRRKCINKFFSHFLNYVLHLNFKYNHSRRHLLTVSLYAAGVCNVHGKLGLVFLKLNIIMNCYIGLEENILLTARLYAAGVCNVRGTVPPPNVLSLLPSAASCARTSGSYGLLEYAQSAATSCTRLAPETNRTNLSYIVRKTRWKLILPVFIEMNLPLRTVTNSGSTGKCFIFFHKFF